MRGTIDLFGRSVVDLKYIQYTTIQYDSKMFDARLYKVFLLLV